MLQRVKIIKPQEKTDLVVAIDLPKGSLPISGSTPCCPKGIYQFTGQSTGMGTESLTVISLHLGNGDPNFKVDNIGQSMDVTAAHFGVAAGLIRTRIRHLHGINQPLGSSEVVFTTLCCPFTSLINHSGNNQNKGRCVNCKKVHTRIHGIHRDYALFEIRP